MGGKASRILGGEVVSGIYIVDERKEEDEGQWFVR